MQTKHWKFSKRYLPPQCAKDTWFILIGTYTPITHALEWRIVGFVSKSAKKWYASHDKGTSYKTRRDAAEAEIKDYIGI